MFRSSFFLRVSLFFFFFLLKSIDVGTLQLPIFNTVSWDGGGKRARVKGRTRRKRESWCRDGGVVFYNARRTVEKKPEKYPSTSTLILCSLSTHAQPTLHSSPRHTSPFALLLHHFSSSSFQRDFTSSVFLEQVRRIRTAIVRTDERNPITMIFSKIFIIPSRNIHLVQRICLRVIDDHNIWNWHFIIEKNRVYPCSLFRLHRFSWRVEIKKDSGAERMYLMQVSISSRKLVSKIFI